MNAAKLWNCLPKSVNTIITLGIFRTTLDLFLAEVPDFPPVSDYSRMNSNSLVTGTWLVRVFKCVLILLYPVCVYRYFVSYIIIMHVYILIINEGR